MPRGVYKRTPSMLTGKHKPTKAERENISLKLKALWASGSISGSKGLKMPPEYGLAISRRQKGTKWSEAHHANQVIYRAKEHPGWKGEEVKYHGLHAWIHKNWGKARICQRLGCKSTSKNYDWANLDLKYNREDRAMWTMLCRSCHRLYDYGKIALTLIGQPQRINTI